MNLIPRWLLQGVIVLVLGTSLAHGVDFDFFGRSGDAIEVNLSAVPGIDPGATFSDLSGLSGHTVLTSDTLTGEPFSNSGRFWLFPNNDRDFPRLGDRNDLEQGFQGTLEGSFLVDGIAKSFQVTVQPGYTGNGTASVGQSSERLNRAANNPLFVAQQQQRLDYFGFVGRNGSRVEPTGSFNLTTDEALRTFQVIFAGGLNTGQTGVDGIVGPTTASWLNAGNAPQWQQLIDPDPQPTGTFSVGGMIGDFDILPGRDPGTGARTGNTPQFEDFASSWAIDLIFTGSAAARASTGRTQLVTALTAPDGYGSSCCHNTHRAGMDIDLHVDSSTWDFGNGVIDSEEQLVIDHALAFIGRGVRSNVEVARILVSNQDVLGGINARAPGVAVFDSSGVHLNHLHVDLLPRGRRAALPNLRGDFNLDDLVTDEDIDLLLENLGGDPAWYNLVASTDVVDSADVAELVQNVLQTRFGDANLDRKVDKTTDGQKLLDNIGSIDLQKWSEADFTGDGVVSAKEDGSLLLKYLGFDGPAGIQPPAPGDGTASATYNPATKILNIHADRVSLIVLEATAGELQILASSGGFSGVAADSEFSASQMEWLSLADEVSGELQLRLGASNGQMPSLVLSYQVIGGDFTSAAIAIVPEPSSGLGILWLLCIILSARTRG